jgi:hypothetical protein
MIILGKPLVVPKTTFMIVIDVVVITNLFILVMYVHMIHHHHRALPSMYENHIIHPLHLIVHVDVVH